MRLNWRFLENRTTAFESVHHAEVCFSLLRYRALFMVEETGTITHWNLLFRLLPYIASLLRDLGYVGALHPILGIVTKTSRDEAKVTTTENLRDCASNTTLAKEMHTHSASGPVNLMNHLRRTLHRLRYRLKDVLKCILVFKFTFTLVIIFSPIRSC